MTTLIKVNPFSRSSIAKAKRELDEYREDLKSKTDEFVHRLAELGVEIARANITSMDAIFNGDLIRSLHVEKSDSGKNKVRCFVVADDNSALYVEFGTGVVGAASPFDGEMPNDFQPNAYASGKRIIEISDGRVGWFYPGDDGNWYFTEGMPSRPFMWQTSLELRERVEEIAREVFG